MNRRLKLLGTTAVLISSAIIIHGCGNTSKPSLDTLGDSVERPDNGRTDSAIPDIPTDNQVPTDTPRDQSVPDALSDIVSTDVPGQDVPDAALPDGGVDAMSDTDSVEPDAGQMPSVEGWISVIETNDTCDQWYMKTQWFGGVRAYFADESNYNRALPHTLGFMTKRDTVGSCTLYDSMLVDDRCLANGMCLCLDKGVECDENAVRWCPEDQYCVNDPEGGEWSRGKCEDLPPHYSVGTITISGLKTDVVMQPDELDRYIFTPPTEGGNQVDMNDLFDMGDEITAVTGGGDLPPLTFRTRGVAPLQISDQRVRIRLSSDAASQIKWTPADPTSRIQVALMIGSHDPNPLAGAIICDVPDSDGSVDVAASLLKELHHLSCDGQWMLKCSRITRYKRDVNKMGDRQAELFVGSARNLTLAFE